MKSIAVLVAVAAIFCGAARSEAAPSFDCAKASGAIEKTICGYSILADSDKKLDETYRAALGAAKGDGAAEIKDSQRQWLRYVSAVCNPKQYDLPADLTTFRNCLTSEYTDRRQLLAKAVRSKGGRLFLTLSQYKAHKSPEADDQKPVTLQVTYPQIVDPQTASDRALNAKLAGMAKKTIAASSNDDDTDVVESIELSAVTPALISFGVSDWSYGHGAAHGLPSSSSIHWLTGAARDLKASDLFEGTAWRGFLRQYCFDAVKHFGFVKSPKDLAGQVDDPGQWNLQKKGLGIDFNPYAVASYADGRQEVVVPWAKLTPYLAKDADQILAGIR